MVERISKYLRGDKVIWGIIILLSLISLLAVYSSTGTIAYRYREGNTLYYFLRQGSFLVMGLLAIYVTHLIHYKYYSRLAQLFLFIAIPLLLVTLLMGTSVNAAPRWLTVPVIGFTIQTSDFAKVAIIMYIARMLAIKQEEIKNFKQSVVPIVVPLGIVCALILPANFSTAFMIFLVGMILMFIGRVSFKHLMLINLVGIVFVALFIFLIPLTKTGLGYRVETWKNRIENFVSGNKDSSDDDNYQAEQAKIAVATGGLLGKGPGNSTQRNFLPNPFSDFIYAIIIEEYGLIGGLVILLLYLILLYRAGVIVRKCERTFPAFLTMGLTLLLVMQAMINMAVAVNLIPVTGQTLPLVSMGGSSILFTSSALGIILSVSRSVLPGENTPLLNESSSSTDENTGNETEEKQQNQNV
ncbi:MAG TPA: FtsW/RodA/SpoVE family cell cycle protein [Bacteroidales bacterium]|mgnify:CR=1 FL=1|nr:FtsW/RodA/SpoVE family cell cycle protein [Bacteroidales bacterium]HPO66357.1 FtsW/RodA/SpoVE family cell cycle protein [Bacteroidales bacterium]